MTPNKNQLIHEKSPYLLQHAHNPVHWHPWGDEAFQKAKQENKPIFLSVGYSTCHWCHVMAEESFEDEEVAAILNDQYVAIKVDREERPDVDSIYMKVCQMMTGHGGWPLTIFMTPDQVPFYAGTYFPKESKYGLPGLIDALHFLADKYEEDPDHIESVTNSVTDALHQATIEKSKHRLNGEHVEQAYKQLAKQFDFRYGGFGKEPKFPMPHNLLFLLHYHYYSGNKNALNMVENTLQSMARGGIFDQIGFGFSRYATDSKWLVPHFEKMLFDNALLLLAYTACYQVTKDPFYQEIGENIIRFVEREMTSRGGVFYSAIDADSEGEEGKYYTFSYEEIYNCLNKELADLFTTIYHITPEGHFGGKNIPNQIGTDFDWVAEQHGLSLRQLNDKLKEARLQLLKYREKRVHPHVDDKILTGWNGLMIAGLAKAGKVFGKQKYIHAAEKAYSFIEGNLIQDRRLMARYRDGQTKYKAYLDDYAYLNWAAIELYEATFTPAYLEKAHQLAVQMNDLFWDEMNGGFYFTGKDSESLIVKDKEVQDGDVPSGNSTAATMLLRLGSLTGRTKWIDRAEEMYYTFYEEINRYPQISPFFLQSLLLAENPSKEVVIIRNEEDIKVEELLRKLQQTFLPDVSLIAADQPNDLTLAAPFAAVYHQVNNQTTVYICENFSCHQPITDLAQVNRTLFGLKVDDSPDKDSE